MRSARPDQIEANARQSRVFATPCKFAYGLWSVGRNRLQRERVTVGQRVFDEVYAPSTLVSACASSAFGTLTLVVMTMTAPAALL